MARRLLPSAAALCVPLLAANPSAALEPLRVGERPVLVEVTEATSVIYNADNRDTRSGDVPSVANDHAGFVYNRLNLSASSEPFRVSLRLDGAWFFASPSPDAIADELVSRSGFEGDARDELYAQKATEAGIELSNRYINWLYPAKYTLSYSVRDFELALGDTTVQLGRGLVLSVRKVDELSSDTTVRGARLNARFRAGATRLRLTAVGGSLNPLRLDEASGRYLGTDSSVTPGFVAVTEAGMPRAIATDFVPEADDCARYGTCSYAPDRILAGGAEVELPALKLGTQASWLLRQEALSRDVVRSAERILTASQSVELVQVGEAGNVYVEAALQKLSHGEAATREPELGHAVYLAASWVDDAFSVLVEGKHYRRFFPLLANVSTSRAREFSLLQYNAPPTTEDLVNDTQFENFNTCVTGGRIRGEAHLTRSDSARAWLGRYSSWAESASNTDCEIRADYENRVWDAAVGFEHRIPGGKLDLSIGTRFDDAGRELDTPSGATHVFYREENLRYTAAVPLGGPFALELDGVHRRRRQTLGGDANGGAWLEGQHTASVEWGDRLAAGVGFEYDDHATAETYFNTQWSYRPNDALVFGLFLGQRRGALRCVGGVCRVYPPFEGGRLDATLRF
jgi:hypothetical protein